MCSWALFGFYLELFGGVGSSLDLIFWGFILLVGWLGFFGFVLFVFCFFFLRLNALLK